MARRTWHRLFRSIFGSFNLRRSQIVRFQTSKLTLERLESREVPAAAINQSLVILSPDIAASVPREELAGSRVIILDASKDAVSQIGHALQANPGASAVRVISHGNSGSLLLAGQLVTGSTLQARSVEVSGWRQYLAPGADILLYGCSVASTADGRNFVNTLGALTGADVAASTDTTGSATLGGNLVLEYATGAIQAPSNRLGRSWNASGLTLGTFTVINTSDSGAGSLRQAIIDANAATDADTIVFAASLTLSGAATINLSTSGNTTAGPSAFGITSPITIRNTTVSGITLNNTFVNQRLFYVSAAGNLTLDSLT